MQFYFNLFTLSPRYILFHENIGISHVNQMIIILLKIVPIL